MLYFVEEYYVNYRHYFQGRFKLGGEVKARTNAKLCNCTEQRCYYDKKEYFDLKVVTITIIDIILKTN